jgi:hypothetical protein
LQGALYIFAEQGKPSIIIPATKLRQAGSVSKPFRFDSPTFGST